jgi:hypothetical protein
MTSVACCSSFPTSFMRTPSHLPCQNDLLFVVLCLIEQHEYVPQKVRKVLTLASTILCRP